MSKKANRRWESTIEVRLAGVPIDELMFTNILAETYQDAQEMVEHRALVYIKNGNYQHGTTVLVRDLYEEGDVPIMIAKPRVKAGYIPPVRNRSHAAEQAGRNKQPQWTTYKPFKCPIVSLCKNKATGTKLGSTIQFTQEEDAS